MSNGLAAIKQSQIDMWNDKDKLEEMKKLISKVKLSDVEFSTFIEIGKGTNLNPFLREIWAVKYDDKSPASIFIGRDGYRKAAQRDPEYDYHQCDAVYENDKYAVVDGVPKHEYNLTNRGALIGAYCIAKRHKSSRPTYVFAQLSEYSTGKSLWNPTTGKPATMIKKVAESQGLRMCFQDLLGGTYGEGEIADHELKVIDGETGRVIPKDEKLMNKIKSAKGQTIDVEPSEPVEQGVLLSPEQLDEIECLLATKDLPIERLKGALELYKVDHVKHMTETQAAMFIKQLYKIADKE